MRIISGHEFANMPRFTVFSKYESSGFDRIAILGEFERVNDGVLIYTCFEPVTLDESTLDAVGGPLKMFSAGYSVKMSEDMLQCAATESDVYLVFEREDVRRLSVIFEAALDVFTDPGEQ